MLLEKIKKKYRKTWHWNAVRRYIHISIVYPGHVLRDVTRSPAGQIARKRHPATGSHKKPFTLLKIKWHLNLTPYFDVTTDLLREEIWRGKRGRCKGQVLNNFSVLYFSSMTVPLDLLYYLFHVSLEVLAAVLLKIRVFWDVTPFWLLKIYRPFEGP
jgi:hypothetical protein